MMGRNHVITGACALESIYVADTLITRADVMPLTKLQLFTKSYLGMPYIMKGIDSLSQIQGVADLAKVISVAGTALLFLAAYFIGTLLPDIDNPKSTLGRFFKLPVKHRTWFHAIYIYLVIAGLGFLNPLFSWLFLGVFVHLFWDSFSAMGNCWFYKILSDYREYPGGAKVKKGHKIKLYHAGEWSEYLLVFLIVAASVASFVWIRRI